MGPKASPAGLTRIIDSAFIRSNWHCTRCIFSALGHQRFCPDHAGQSVGFKWPQITDGKRPICKCERCVVLLRSPSKSGESARAHVTRNFSPAFSTPPPSWTANLLINREQHNNAARMTLIQKVCNPWQSPWPNSKVYHSIKDSF